ncbi:hypothetical protein [Treponema pedis]|uniref:Outer membrane protein beta-barrel domain-containing protein n=1 Tax=Treponema pedis TaxID=409322 RepID=A0A7S7AWH6_9SPIR|nr:hypothetical protein IFE08_13010 [Treponema pedis]QSI03965.1 hypothetical protein DYQ05_03020 [Treponema pedis]
MKKFKLFVFIFLFAMSTMHISAFDKGFTLGFKANFTGSYTDPHINEADKKYLGAAYIKGMLGFVMNGEAELTYIFDSKRFFNYQSNDVFSGLGLAFNLGIGQNFSGQVSGQYRDGIGQIDVYCRVFMTPVLHFGAGVKTYFFKNRFALGFTLGGKMPMDPDPTYEMYSNLNEEKLKELKKAADIDFSAETGTLVVPQEVIKKINPLGFLTKLSLEYYQPVIPTMQITVGGFLQYYVFRPNYVTMPKKIEDAAIKNGKIQEPKVDVNFKRDPIKSFYMNSVDFGISLGLLFSV